MPELSKSVIPPHMGDKRPSEKILKLGRKITDVAAHKIKGVTVDDAEYWGLAEIVTDEMADVALKMKLRHHYKIEELWKLLLLILIIYNVIIIFCLYFFC